MIFIDLENNPPDDAWIAKADALTQQLINAPDEATRNQIIDANANVWGELKTFLGNLNNQKCWYTESVNAAAHCHVDHFRPKKEALDEAGDNKGGYWWLAFEWRNYRFSGPAPNVKKRSWFHVDSHKANDYGDATDAEQYRMLDPTEIGDPELLSFDNEGNVSSKNSNKTSWDYIRVEYSVRRLDLNHEKLKEPRRDLYRETSNEVRRVIKLMRLQKIKDEPTRRVEIKGLMKGLRVKCNRSSQYSAAAKYCLRSTGLDWAIDIVSSAA